MRVLVSLFQSALFYLPRRASYPSLSRPTIIKLTCGVYGTNLSNLAGKSLGPPYHAPTLHPKIRTGTARPRTSRDFALATCGCVDLRRQLSEGSGRSLSFRLPQAILNKGAPPESEQIRQGRRWGTGSDASSGGINIYINIYIYIYIYIYICICTHIYI